MKFFQIVKSPGLMCLAAILAVLFCVQSVGYAQGSGKIQVSGKVVDSKNQPIIGASVIVEGTTIGTSSDANGAFSLSCERGKTLAVSFVSYKTQKVAAGSALPLIVVLQEDAQSIDEVVVVAVGYGSMRKSDLTGAITSVSSDKMKKGVITSSEQLLQGKVAGMTVIQGSGDPTAGSSLRLRGGTSLTASNSPLIVVDGIPGVDMNTVQPSEIASIDVLKDASATAIYGSRGANGVIIVTTNRPKNKGAVEYAGYVAVGSVAKNLDMLSANQWRGYVRNNNVTGAVDYGANTDWQKELEQTGITHSHTISISNGNDKSSYRASVNYMNNEGIIERTGLERMGVNLTASNTGLNNRLKFDIGAFGNFDTWKPLDYRIFERMYNLNPTIPVKDANGNFSNVGGTNYENPVELNTNRTVQNKRHRFLGFTKVELEIVDGLKGVANLSYEYNTLKTNQYIPTYAVLTGVTDKGYGQKTLADYTNAQLETYLTYDKSFNEHKVNLMAGYSYLDNTYEGFGAERRGFDTDLFLYNNLAAGQDYRAGDVYSYKGKSNLISFFGRVNYSYKSKYMFIGTLRRDGSSRFGDNNKWGMFPSASVAWRVSAEPFMAATQGWLNNLKLRVGYGVTGNQDGIGEYKSLSILGAGGASYYDAATNTWKQSYGPTQNPNPNLKWESTKQINIGLDFTLFSRINGTLEIYSKKTSDLLYTYEVPQPPYLVGTMLANVGDLSNKGIELTLSANVYRKGDFSADVDLTLAHNKQKIEKLSNQTYSTDAIYSGSLHSLRGMSNQFSQVIKEGYPVGTFWGPECTGLTSDYKFIIPDPDKKVDLGNVQPKMSMGFNVNLSYKKFDMAVATYGMFGQKVLNATAMTLNDPSRLPAQNVPDSYLKTPISSNPTFSSYWIEDASFFRLQTVTLGYSFKAEKYGFNKVRCYLTGENLFVITGYSGLDPEVSIDGLASPGIDMLNYYPKPRTFSFGVNVTF